MPRLKLFTRAAALRHGRVVLIFNNLRTNQILFSLTRTRENDHLKQLSFFGKKTLPPSIRRDMWQPFITIVFPRGHERQGLIVYQRLREYRMFRDVNWRQRKDLKQYDAFSRNRLDPDEDGKIPNIWKARQKILMNQKADTVADIAAILERQAVIEAQKRGELEGKEARKAVSAANRARKLKNAANRAKLKVLESNIRNLQKALKRGRGKGLNTQPKTGDEKVKWEKNMRRQIERLTWEKGEIRKALESTREPEPKEQTEPRRQLNSVNELLEDLRKMKKKGPPKHLKSKGDQANWLKRVDGLTEEALIESNYLKKEYLSKKRQSEAEKRKTHKVSKRMRVRKTAKEKLNVLRERRVEQILEAKMTEYLPELDKILIQWADILDAQRIQNWPADVIHGFMGRTRAKRFEAPEPSLISQPGLSKKEEEYMEKNVRLDGEANEEGDGQEEDAAENEESAETQEETEANEDEDNKKDAKVQGNKWNPLSWYRSGAQDSHDVSRP